MVLSVWSTSSPWSSLRSTSSARVLGVAEVFVVVVVVMVELIIARHRIGVVDASVLVAMIVSIVLVVVGSSEPTCSALELSYSKM
jgi:hypothetical protein